MGERACQPQGTGHPAGNPLDSRLSILYFILFSNLSPLFFPIIKNPLFFLLFFSFSSLVL
jgi:hypothetical protein